MPPVSNMRTKAPPHTNRGATTTISHISDFGTSSANNPRRTASGRAVRTNTTRPSNYYARPLGSFTNNNNNNNNNAPAQDADPPGFFPALQYFSNAIDALPKDVVRQFTLMKEAEGKSLPPHERFGEVVEKLLELPVPSVEARKGEGEGGLGMLSFTANNSASGSARASVVNGATPGASQHDSTEEENGNGGMDLETRRKFHELVVVSRELLPSMDEKSVVLAETNRVLAQQLMKIDSVLPHLDNEISDVARYGSLTHWAYSDNRVKKQVAGPGGARGRDAGGANILAAAGQAVHETEIAQARGAGKETVREKGKSKMREVVDSDFDDKPKKGAGKGVGKGKSGAALAGLNAAGEPVKKRKVDKGLMAPGMERSTSTKKAAKEVPRSTPMAEAGVKKAKTKPAPAPLKKKGITSAHASPALTSSPLHSSFGAAMELPSARQQSGRLRQNSTTNLRHERLIGGEAIRPGSAAGAKEKIGSKRKAPIPDDYDPGTNPNEAKKTIETDPDTGRPADRSANRSRSNTNTNSGKAGRGSKTGTPRAESGADVPSMKRTRSTRSMRGNREESEAGTAPRRKGHRRFESNSHLVKQLAPFNRSPNMDNKDPEDEDEEDEGEGGFEEGEGGEMERRSPRKKKRARLEDDGMDVGTGSEREGDGDGDGDVVMPEAQSPLPMSRRESPDANPSPANSPTPAPRAAVSPSRNVATSPSPVPSSTAGEQALDPYDGPHSEVEPADDEINDDTIENIDEDEPEQLHNDLDEDDEEDADEESGDPDDPDEPKYCYCDRGSYGAMIGCDGPRCAREWFHLGCTELREVPGAEVEWFCRECAPSGREKVHGKNGGGRGRGRGRGRGKG